MDFLSSPPTAGQSVLHELGYDVYDFDQKMSLTQDHFMIDRSMNENFNLVPSAPASESSESRYWKASLDAPPGREGETPYLDLDDFESAEGLQDPYNNHVDGETIFTSLQESVHWRSQQVVENKPEYDATIPRSQDLKCAYVKLLFKAWKSTASATDNPGMKKPFDEERHDNARVECLCWMLLEALIRRSEMGPLLVAYDPTKTKETPALNSFAVRFDEVVISLRQQKTICKHLLDAPYVNVFVDDPVRARNRVASNRDLNRKKGTTMSLGKEQLRKGSERGTSRKGKKRAKSISTDGEFSDEPSPMYSQSPSTLYGSTLGRSAYHSRGRSKTGTRNSSQYTPTSTRSGYGSSGFYKHSPVDLQMNARVPPISYPASPTLGRNLTRHNTQTSTGQSAVHSPSSTPLDLPQSMLGDYNSMMGQAISSAFMFPTPFMSHPDLAGVGEQVSGFKHMKGPSEIANKDISSSISPHRQVLRPPMHVSVLPLHLDRHYQRPS
jgi:hypothetical protein